MSSDRIKQLEQEVARLKEKEVKLEHDLEIYRQIFLHLKVQFEEMKRQLIKK
jgi:predicted  nucleic acid-binding Zn-ribbon protein